MGPIVPKIKSLLLPDGPYEWFKTNSSKLFMLGEGNYAFSRALSKVGMPPRYTSNVEGNVATVSGSTTYNQVDATRLHADQRVLEVVQDKGIRCFAWNFPFVGGAEENPVAQESLLLSTLQSFVLLQEQTKTSISLAITLQGDQFSRWNVLRSIWRTNWCLTGWCEFDYEPFSGYFPSRANGDKFPCDLPSFYLLQLPLKEERASPRTTTFVF